MEVSWQENSGKYPRSSKKVDSDTEGFKLHHNFKISFLTQIVCLMSSLDMKIHQKLHWDDKYI